MFQALEFIMLGSLRQFLSKHILQRRTCNIRVLDHEGEPVSGADVVIPGLGRSRTNKQGYTKFYLTAEEWYSLIISYDNHEEVLYQEVLSPGGSYVYRPDSSIASGRLWASSSE